MLTTFFQDLTKADAAIAGGKGASLGEMTQAAIPVPPGFVVLTAAFERFLEETNLQGVVRTQLDQVNPEDYATIEKASEAIQGRILQAEMPEDIRKAIESSFSHLATQWVAVRSSATAEDGQDASWAGELDSFLNVSETELIEKVQQCWASLFTPRAIFYSIEKGFHKGKVSVAVVVQKMVEAEVSGIAFSVHPVTQNPNQLIIEAGYGLGEAIVSGSITPDSYVFDKQRMVEVEVSIASQERGLYKKQAGGSQWQDIPVVNQEKRKLPLESTKELAQLIIQIEQHYGFPCDIEWAWEKGRLFIVQSRPITTLSASPPGQGVVEKFSSLNQFVTKQEGNFSYLLYGSLLPGVFHIQKYYPIDFGALIFAYQNNKGSCFFNFEVYQRITEEAFQNALNLETINVMPELQDFARLEAEIKAMYAKCTDAELAKTEADSLLDLLREEYRYHHQLLAATVFSEALDEALVAKLYTSLGGTAAGLAKFQEYSTTVVFQSFLTRLDSEIVTAYRTDPPSLQWIFTDYFTSPLAKNIPTLIENKMREMGGVEAINKEREQVLQQIEKNTVEVEKYKRSLSKDLLRLFEFVQQTLYLRDIRKEAVHKINTLTVNTARYLLSPQIQQDLIPYAYYEDFINEAFAQPDYVELLEKRKEGGLIYFDKNGSIAQYDNLEVTLQELYTLLQAEQEKGVVKGSVGNKGQASGRACIVMARDQFGKFQEGDILITSMTRPEFVPLMRKAAAIITDEGGVTCHAAIISRELHKPCVIGTKNATQIIKDGDLIEVDANKGIIRITP